MIEVAALKRRANAIARTALSPLPLEFWRTAFPKDLVALCYHVVSDEDLPHLRLYRYKNSDQFEADVQFARSRAVTYKEVAQHRLHGRPLPRNSYLFTFDDGLAQCFDVARPILKRHGVDAVFFVTIDYLDNQTPFHESVFSLLATNILQLSETRSSCLLQTMSSSVNEGVHDLAARAEVTKRIRDSRIDVPIQKAQHRLITELFAHSSETPWLQALCRLLDVNVDAYIQTTPIFMTRDQVQQLARDGFTVGAHGRTHKSLQQLPFHELEYEIVSACDAIKQITQQERVPFAFPYSGLNIPRTSLKLIMKRNPMVELFFDSGCLRNDETFVVNRVFADSPMNSALNISNLSDTLRREWSTPSAWSRSQC